MGGSLTSPRMCRSRAQAHPSPNCPPTHPTVPRIACSRSTRAGRSATVWSPGTACVCPRRRRDRRLCMPLPSVAVFGSHPLLGVTIERRGTDEDDVHMHAAGQGVWVARMAAALDAHPILCGFIGGETGQVLRPLLDRLDAELRLVDMDASRGCYVIDRRRGGRDRAAGACGA